MCLCVQGAYRRADEDDDGEWALAVVSDGLVIMDVHNGQPSVSTFTTPASEVSKRTNAACLSLICMCFIISLSSILSLFPPEEQQFWVPQWEGPLGAQEFWRCGVWCAEGHAGGICSKSDFPLCARGFCICTLFTFHSLRLCRHIEWEKTGFPYFFCN